jgi:hypothetical protein
MRVSPRKINLNSYNIEMKRKVKIKSRRPSKAAYEELVDDDEVLKISIDLTPEYSTGDLTIETKYGTYDVLPNGCIVKREETTVVWNYTRNNSF